MKFWDVRKKTYAGILALTLVVGSVGLSGFAAETQPKLTSVKETAVPLSDLSMTEDGAKLGEAVPSEEVPKETVDTAASDTDSAAAQEDADEPAASEASVPDADSGNTEAHTGILTGSNTKLPAPERPKASELSNESVSILNRIIKQLPTVSKAKTMLSGLSKAEAKAYENWVSQTAQAGLDLYDRLSDAQKVSVKGTDKLTQLAKTWPVDITKHYTHTWKQAVSVVNELTESASWGVFQGGQKLSSYGGWDLTDWYVFVADDRVSDTVTVYAPGTDKRNIVAPEDEHGVLVAMTSSEAASVGYDSGMEVYDSQLTTEGSEDSLSVVLRTQAGSVNAKAKTYPTAEGLSKVSSASTKDLIRMNLWDYDATVNAYFDQDAKYPGFGNPAEGVYSSVKTGSAGDLSIRQLGNQVTSDEGRFLSGTGTMDGKLVKGWPSRNQKQIGYLFADQIDGVHRMNTSKESIDGLFTYDDATGKYSYDSRKCAAIYQKKSNRFQLYDGTMTADVNLDASGSFLPLASLKSAKQAVKLGSPYFYVQQKQALELRNQAKEGSREWMMYQQLYQNLIYCRQVMDAKFGVNKWTLRDFAGNGDLSKKLYQVDYTQVKDTFFGMDAHLQFLHPKKGQVQLSNGKSSAMQFQLSGTDDLLVYLDGLLVLDFSDAKGLQKGVIDFAKGQVQVGKQVTKFTKLFPKAMLTEEGLLRDGSIHNLDLYYLDRNSGANVLAMDFNLPLLKTDSLYVGKKLTVAKAVKDQKFQGNPEFSFQILKKGVENYVSEKDLAVKPGTEYRVYDKNFKDTGAKRKVGKDGIFKLKADEYARFSQLDAKSGYFVRELLETEIAPGFGVVSVNGTVATERKSVSVGKQKFTGCDSSLHGLSEGTVVLQFVNQLDALKMGSLEIKKEVLGTTTQTEFVFHVVLDETPIYKGTTYTKRLPDGTLQKQTVESEGIVVLKANEAAIFADLLPGSTYLTFQDVLDPSGGHSVDWVFPKTAKMTENGLEGTVASEGDGHHTKLICRDGFTQVQIAKLDEDGQPLAGAQIQLFSDADTKHGLPMPGKTPVHTFTTQAEPEVLTAKLSAGQEYWAVETVAAEEHDLAEPQSFTVAKAGKTTEVKLESEPSERVFGNLQITNQVTGSGGNREKDFPITLWLDTEQVNVTATKNGLALDCEVRVTPEKKTEVQFSMRDGDAVVFADLPVGVAYKVSESDYKGYQLEMDHGEGVLQFADADTITVQIKNHRDVTLRTGVRPSGVLTWPVLLGFSIVGVLSIGGYLWYRRKYFFD